MSNIAVRPYVDPKNFNLGLEKHNQVLFDGIKHGYEMASILRGDTWIYKTGLDESDPEVLKLPVEEREAKIKNIREIASRVERQLTGADIKPNDKEFWNKIVKLKPTNSSFWRTVRLELSNEPTVLDPNDPLDLLRITSIEAGGWPEVAKSKEIAKAGGSKTYKFYLDKLEETVETDNSTEMLRTIAGAKLQDLYENNVNKLLLVSKVVDANSSQYKKSTPIGILWRNMNAYIKGETVDNDKKQTAQRFIDIAGLDMETLKLRALVKDASWYKLIITRGDGVIYDIETGAALGHTNEEIVQYLKNPIHEEVMMSLIKKVEKYWNE